MKIIFTFNQFTLFLVLLSSQDRQVCEFCVCWNTRQWTDSLRKPTGKWCITRVCLLHYVLLYFMTCCCKEKWSKTQTGLKTSKLKVFGSADNTKFVCCSSSNYVKEALFYNLNLSSQGAAISFALFHCRVEKARDVFDTFAGHYVLVNDVTDTDWLLVCWTFGACDWTFVFIVFIVLLSG